MRSLFPSFMGWFQRLSPRKRTLLTILGLCTGFLLLSWTVRRPETGTGLRQHDPQRVVPTPHGEQMEAELNKQWNNLSTATQVPSAPNAVPQQLSGGLVDWSNENSPYPAPLIQHAAEVAVTTQEFVRSRTKLEEILEQHHGYAAKLRMEGQPSGSTLTATLRVPSSEFNGVVTDLKTLGNVQREEQAADEITAQRADLDARLRSAQNTLARLKDALEQGWKAGNPADTQRQLASVSAEIARLEAERSATERRVLFSQVLFSLQEEITPTAVSFGARFRNAAAEGFSEALSDLTAIVLFVIGRGPAILLWVVLLYFPSRWLWRRWHGSSARSVSLEPGV
jgi:Domain of unknown function (DUF4349)